MCNLKIFQEPGFGGSGTAFSACADLPSLSDAPVMGSVKSASELTAVMGSFCSTQYRQPALTSRSFDIASQIHQYLSSTKSQRLFYPYGGTTSVSPSPTAIWLVIWTLVAVPLVSSVKIGDCPVYWSSRLQGTVSSSTHWAQLRACSDAIEQIQFLRFFLQEIGFGQDEPTPVFVDNRSAVFTGSQSSLRIRVVRSTLYGSRISSLRLCSSKKLL